MSKARRDFKNVDPRVKLSRLLLLLLDKCNATGFRFGQALVKAVGESDLTSLEDEELFELLQPDYEDLIVEHEKHEYTNYGLLGTWYDLRSALPLALGQALLYQANHNMGFDPYYGGPDCTDPDKAFREDLIKHGTALINWYEEDDDDKNNLMKAIAALHWFANNLEEMWD